MLPRFFAESNRKITHGHCSQDNRLYFGCDCEYKGLILTYSSSCVHSFICDKNELSGITLDQHICIICLDYALECIDIIRHVYNWNNKYREFNILKKIWYWRTDTLMNRSSVTLDFAKVMDKYID